ncbi:MAG: 50S ribosomal protein L3 N(5)-glutamine methyltransferase [Ectothiorhodospiraceae bacterium]|nr:50S ribosomal protein L3 N(5)-glutamine methyltransferase [Ectothiorhodospiraceae bacterium]
MSVGGGRAGASGEAQHRDLDALLAEAQDALETIADLVRFATTVITREGVHLGHGTDDPVDEAVWIVLGAVSLEPGLADELWSARLLASERRRVLALLRRRVVERIPAAYLIGRAWFAGLRFEVDERVLVPRSPLAEWIERGFEPLVEPESVHRVLDLGTGSGCIAIACAHAFPQASVDAVDVSDDALAVAARNVRAHGLEDRVHLTRSDVFSAIDGRYDLIVSNPPYVPRASHAAAPPEYHHEPAGGLVAGEDGLAVVERILAGAAAHLCPSGVLVCEVGEAHVAVVERWPDLPLTWLEFERGGDGVFAIAREDLPGA